MTYASSSTLRTHAHTNAPAAVVGLRGVVAEPCLVAERRVEGVDLSISKISQVKAGFSKQGWDTRANSFIVESKRVENRLTRGRIG